MCEINGLCRTPLRTFAFIIIFALRQENLASNVAYIWEIQDSIKIEIKYKVAKIRNRETGKISQVTEEIGRYDHQYDSTAAHGGTIFWKLNPEFLKVTKGWECK